MNDLKSISIVYLGQLFMYKEKKKSIINYFILYSKLERNSEP